jgi:hypothetical protein
MTDKQIARFWKRVDIQGENECWNWTGCATKKVNRSEGLGYSSTGGYGMLRYAPEPKTVKTVYAHRVAYELTLGGVPQGMTIDHLCRNKLCCNPQHMEIVTRSENSRRQAVKQDRVCKMGKESHLRVRQLRQARFSIKEISERFGVSTRTINRALKDAPTK